MSAPRSENAGYAYGRMMYVVMLQVDVCSNSSDGVSRSVSLAVHRRCKTVQVHADAVSTLH